ncbi:MAG: aldehyde dehydrogenase [Rikenellaceae bacterium]
MDSTIETKVERARVQFNSGITRPIEWRREQLRRLKQVIIEHQSQIEQALWSDLRKSPEECYLTEISIVVQEIDLHIRNLQSWAKPQRVATPIHLSPSSSYVYHEPLGVALIIAPWNYPLQLVVNPLIGAISAGCTAIIKPSPDAPATAAVIQKIIDEAFSTPFIEVIIGEREQTIELLKLQYDMIFFTGSPQFGRVVYQAAAQNLTPVVLELGGKSPCIVDKDANIEVAARRIAWGKWINAGQTCIAPDYLFVHRSVKGLLLKAIVDQCQKMYGRDAATSRFYPRIVTHAAFDRIAMLTQNESIYYGAEVDREDRYISPTIIDNITPRSKIMQEEIFGPILPVMTFDNLDNVVAHVNSQERPLALYYFGNNDSAVLSRCTSGGACINDTIMHISNHRLPFGGVGNSGIGRYHGKTSFEAFSNLKSVVKTPTWLDLPLRYPPFKYFKLIKRLL